MKHLGDITKIDGAKIEVVDVITGGSPCQDLSVAGNRSGLAGTRSGLFMEQIRIVKEMRKADERNGGTDEPVRPRYMVWENVAGAFSSSGGRDFAKAFSDDLKDDKECVYTKECLDRELQRYCGNSFEPYEKRYFEE